MKENGLANYSEVKMAKAETKAKDNSQDSSTEKVKKKKAKI